MINPNDLVRLFHKALDEKWGYIWGMSGQTWTATRQASATRDMTVKYGSRWIGRRVADCSGMFAWAFRQLGGYMYHGSNTMWLKYCTAQGKLSKGARDDGNRMCPGTAVFMYNNGKRGHVGLYVGNGKVIEAKGTRYGVVMSDVFKWHEWGELKGVAYDKELIDKGVMPMVTVKFGDRGAAVVKLQDYLKILGYDVGKADGIFGGQTSAALRTFQSDKGLKVDGVAGVKTWAAIDKAFENKEKPAHEQSDTQTPDYSRNLAYLTRLIADLDKKIGLMEEAQKTVFTELKSSVELLRKAVT